MRSVIYKRSYSICLVSIRSYTSDSMYQLVRTYSFGNKKVWTRQIFRAGSVAPDAWTAPMRYGFLELYKVMNEIIARYLVSKIHLLEISLKLSSEATLPRLKSSAPMNTKFRL